MTNTTLTPPVAGDTKRAFLVRNGLAKEGARGRFGRDAIAALEQFSDFTFADVTPVAKPKTPKAEKDPATPKPPKAPKVAKVETKADTAQRAPSPLDMPRRRPENSGFTTVGNILVRQDTCGSCKAPVSKCNEKTGPRAHAFLEKENGGVLPLTLDKPLV